MQCFEKCDERGCLRGAQILAVRWHIAASLDHLPDELVLREPRSNTVESGASLPAAPPQGMAVAALLSLKDQGASPFKRGCPVQKLRWHGCAAPRVHLRTPGSVLGEMSECAEDDREQHHGQYG